MRLLRGNSSNGCVGLDVDGAFIAAVELADGGVARAASSDLPAGIVLEGEVADPRRLSSELKKLFKDADLPRRVRVGVANRHIALREFSIPKIDDAEHRESAVRYQTAESIVMPLEESVLDYQVVGEREGAQGATLERIVVVAARQTMLQKLVEAVRGAGLRPEGIDLSAFALVRALAADGQGEGGRTWPSSRALSASSRGRSARPLTGRVSTPARSARSCGSRSTTTGARPRPAQWTRSCSPVRARRWRAFRVSSRRF